MLDPRLTPAVQALERGLAPDAARLARHHLTDVPFDGSALQLLGVASRDCGRGEDTVRWFGRSVAVSPDSPVLLAALAGAHIDRADMRAARRFLRRAVALAPDVGLYSVSISTTFGRSDPAAEHAWLRRALALDPEDGGARCNLAIWFRREDRLDRAARESRKALALLPAQPEGLNNLAILATRAGDIGGVEAWTGRAMATRPGFAEARWNRAIARLLDGRLADAWPDAEARFDVPGAQKHHPPRARRWRGEAAPGKTLLLFAEQGLGDTIQFCRYAPLATGRGLRTILAVQPPLVTLLKSLDGVADVVAADGRGPDHDWNCPLMSLPGLFGTTVDSVPATVPYLAARESGRNAWRARLGAGRMLRVGLSWQGNPSHLDDRRRSLPLGVLDGLRRLPGLQLVAVRTAGEPIPAGWPMLDAAPWLRDMADTADLLAELDLLIACDTAVAHLAGALGRPVWTLLAHAPDWRWMLSRTDTPWYPTMRLFRQPRAGDWSAVADEVERALAAMMKGSHDR